MKIEELLAELDEKSSDNFTADDLHILSKIKDLDMAKAKAIELINKDSAKPLRPQKRAWFTQAITRARSSKELTQILWNMLLGGEGHAVIGSGKSMTPSSYRTSFGEATDKLWRPYDIDGMTAMTLDGQMHNLAGSPQRISALPTGSIILGAQGNDEADVSKTSYTIYKKVSDSNDIMDGSLEEVEWLKASPYAKPDEVNKLFAASARKLIS